MTDSIRCAGAFRYVWLFLLSTKSEYCERKIPDVIHYSAEIWRSGKSRDFHRRVSMRVCTTIALPLLIPFLERWQSSSSSTIRRFPLDLGEIEKLTPLFAGVPQCHRRAPSAHTRFPLYDAPRRFLAMPRFRWIFLRRIHNVHLCTGQ